MLLGTKSRINCSRVRKLIEGSGMWKEGHVGYKRIERCVRIAGENRARVGNGRWKNRDQDRRGGGKMAMRC